MGITQSQFDKYIAANGPYLYHDTQDSRALPKIMESGLVPWDHRDDNYRGFGDSRRGRVYLGAPFHIHQWMNGFSNPMFRVNISTLDPALFAADEDFIHDEYRQGNDMDDPFVVELMEALPELVLDVNGYADWNPDCGLPPAHTMPIADWCDDPRVARLLDSERATLFSFMQGSVSYHGSIPSNLVELNPEWIKYVKAHPQRVGSAYKTFVRELTSCAA